VARVLFIGLDGFGYDFTARAFAAGFMPFMADRAAAGAFGPAASTIPPVSTAAWTTIATGVGIGKHGVVDFRRREMADYGFARPGRLVNAADVRAPRVYELAAEAGLRSFVLNLPVTYPAVPVNGVLVAGVLTPPGSDKGYWPPSFREYLADYAYDLEAPVPAELPALCRRLEELAAGRVRVAAAAFARERFDLAIVIFTGPDRLFHRFYRNAYGWENPADVPPAAAAYLRALDAACEKVFEAFGADAALVACSDHGFGPGPTRAFYVNRLLKRAGLLSAGGGPGSYAWNVILEGARKLFGRGRPLAVDWRRTTAYGFPLYMRWGGVALNVAGGVARRGRRGQERALGLRGGRPRPGGVGQDARGIIRRPGRRGPTPLDIPRPAGRRRGRRKGARAARGGLPRCRQEGRT
jgi:predicted AlkP superfamily phosphohydrolase/phosphomutase